MYSFEDIPVRSSTLIAATQNVMHFCGELPKMHDVLSATSSDIIIIRKIDIVSPFVILTDDSRK